MTSRRPGQLLNKFGNYFKSNGPLKFEHLSLVSGLSQILLELGPHNLINRLVVMRRNLEGPGASGHE